MIWLIITLILLSAAFIYAAYRVFLMYFLRDPERPIPSGDNIISPADGKVIAVVDIKQQKIEMKKGFIGRIRGFTHDLDNVEHSAISIFMNVHDVHVNRAPYAGKAISVKHSTGKFYHAGTPEAFENEKVETVLETKIGKIKVMQIAGLVARRIEPYIGRGDVVIKGQRIGIIKLGSQVTLIVPKDKVEFIVKKGDRVYAGKSIIGRIIYD